MCDIVNGEDEDGGVKENASVFFFSDTAPTETYPRTYTLALHDALPISHFRVLRRMVMCVLTNSPYEVWSWFRL